MKKRWLVLVLLLTLAAALPLTGALAAIQGKHIENLKPQAGFEANHVYLDINKTGAAQGETVLLTMHLEDDYVLVQGTLLVSYYDESGDLHFIEPVRTANENGMEYSFVMPNFAVSVDAEVRKHEIQVTRDGRRAIEGTDYVWIGNNCLQILKNGLTVSGTVTQEKIAVRVPGSAELTMEELHISNIIVPMVIDVDTPSNELTLTLKGKNELLGKTTSNLIKAGYGALTIDGDGSLDITAMDNAIYSRYDTKIKGGTLNIICGVHGIYSDRGNVEISGNANLNLTYKFLYPSGGVTPTAIHSKAGDVTISTTGKIAISGQNEMNLFDHGIYAAGNVDISRATIQGKTDETVLNGGKSIRIHDGAKITAEADGDEETATIFSAGWVEIDSDCSVTASSAYYHAVGKKLRINHIANKPLGTILFRNLYILPYSLLDLDDGGSLDLPIDCDIFGTTEQTDDPGRMTLPAYIKDNKLYVNDPYKGEALARAATVKAVEPGKLPETGDSMNVPLLLTLMALAVCSLAWCVTAKRRA